MDRYTIWEMTERKRRRQREEGREREGERDIKKGGEIEKYRGENVILYIRYLYE